MESKFRKKSRPAEEKQMVVEEVIALLEFGYRPFDKDQIVEGLEIAIEEYGDKEWLFWSNLPLGVVINDLYYLGTP